MKYDLTNAIHEICEIHGFSSKIESVAIDVMFDVHDCCDIENLHEFCERAINALCDGIYLACLDADEDIIEVVLEIYQQLKDSIVYTYSVWSRNRRLSDYELPGLREHEDRIGYSEPHTASIIEFMQKNNFCGLDRAYDYQLEESEQMLIGDIEGSCKIVWEF